MTDDWTVKSVTHALGDARGHRIDLETLGQRAGQPCELFRLAPSLLRLAVEPRVLERQGRLVGERLRQPRVLGIEHASGAIGHRQRAEQPVAHDQRRAEQRAVGVVGQTRAHRRRRSECACRSARRPPRPAAARARPVRPSRCPGPCWESTRSRPSARWPARSAGRRDRCGRARTSARPAGHRCCRPRAGRPRRGRASPTARGPDRRARASAPPAGAPPDRDASARARWRPGRQTPRPAPGRAG